MTFYQFYISLLRIETKMKQPNQETLECSPITPAKILDDFIQESEKEDSEGSLIRKLIFTQNNADQHEDELTKAIEKSKKMLKETIGRLSEVQTDILKINKYHESFIELHDTRRTFQKDIIDLEFDILKQERELDILRRNRSAVSIVEEEEQELVESSPSKEEHANETIKQAPEEEEESLRLTNKKMVQNSVIRMDTKNLFESEIGGDPKKEDNPQSKMKILNKTKTLNKIKPSNLRESKQVPLSTSILYTPKKFQKSPLLKNYQSEKRLKTFGHISSDELYRSRLELSLTYDRMALNYISSKYLY